MFKFGGRKWQRTIFFSKKILEGGKMTKGENDRGYYGNCKIYLILFYISSMIYTAINRQHISNVYAAVELLFFREASSWVVWASLTLLSLITVVACCFIVMNYYQNVSLELNHGPFFQRMSQISIYSLWDHLTS